jgi:hypothetical protein
LFLVAGLVLLVVVITLAGELPLNNKIEGWSIEQPPSDWTDVRNEWETLHAIRAVASAAALSVLYLSVPLAAAKARM